MATEWYETALKSSGLIAWYYMRDERDNRNYLSLVRKIDFLTQHTSGVLVINVNRSQAGLDSQSGIVRDDDRGRDNHIVSANRPGRVGKTLADISFDPKVIE